MIGAMGSCFDCWRACDLSHVVLYNEKVLRLGRCKVHYMRGAVDVNFNLIHVMIGKGKTGGIMSDSNV